MVIKIGTLNVCLGLTNKKTIVKQLIIQEKIDILCLQETDIVANCDSNLMSFPGYCYESEVNSNRARVGVYINSKINFIRRQDLEGTNSHLLIIDVKGVKNVRLINIYRCFNPVELSPRQFFNYQLRLIKNAFNDNTLLLGDMNLDWSKKWLNSYQFKAYFDDMDLVLNDLNLTQVVNFPTWSRSVNNIHKESTLDHIYCQNPLNIINLHSLKPHFGDHLMISFDIEGKLPRPVYAYKRSWVNYSKGSLCTILAGVNWNIDDDSVQDYWNTFENKLINVVDGLIPITKFTNNTECNQSLPPRIKNILNIRKRLLKKLRVDRSLDLKSKIKELDRQIKMHFHENKAKKVRRTIIPGNTNSIWKAVRIATNINATNLPKTLFENKEEIPNIEVPDRFANHFDIKIRNILREVKINDAVYNGIKKVEAENKNFMDLQSVRECITSLKIKNTEGFDRIPQRVLVDGIDYLLAPLTTLMNRIYEQKQVPEQWLVAKTIPIYKNKGANNDIQNYRPIANLCTTSKIFEKLIMKRINEIQDSCEVDLTGENQHGFKRNRSTSTLSVTLQSMISRAINEGKYGLIASLDLSSAFDVVNIKLLIKRLKVAGLPSDIIDLISKWLDGRSYYVCVDGENSIIHSIRLGTVQGSILGPLLYAIYVSPLFDVEDLMTFADDNFIPRFNNNLQELITDMEKSLESITRWLRDSGLVVNKTKTEICIFYRHECQAIDIRVEDTIVKTKNVMNVLGVLFDTKLTWCGQVAKSITKSEKALNAIKLIRRYFNTKELLQLLTSNYYSILYYNCEVWLLNSLKINLKYKIFAASAKALRMSLHYPKHNISYLNLHLISNRATPNMFGNYKLALLLHKLYNSKIPSEEWLHLNFDQILTTRQTHFMTNVNINCVTGKNALTNRLNHLNGKILLEHLNYGINQFKIECKKIFLTNFY